MSNYKLGDDTLSSKFIHLKVRRRDGVESFFDDSRGG